MNAHRTFTESIPYHTTHTHTLNHKKKRNNASVGDTRHFNDEIHVADLGCLESLQVDTINPDGGRFVVPDKMVLAGSLPNVTPSAHCTGSKGVSVANTECVVSDINIIVSSTGNLEFHRVAAPIPEQQCCSCFVSYTSRHEADTQI